MNNKKGVLDASMDFAYVLSSMKVQFPNELMLFVDAESILLLHLFQD